MLVALIVGFSGCSVKQTGTTPSNPSSETQTKFVRIDSEPQGATVYIDNNEPITTPADVELSLGSHYIRFKKDGYEDYVTNNAEVKEDTTNITVTLKELPNVEELADFAGLGPIVFYTVPHFACCSKAAITYSNIFYGGTYTVSGKTTLESFDIVFPSGKKVHFDTEGYSKIRKFSKVVKFDELGGYEIVSNGEVEYTFRVDYKPTILSPTPKLTDIFESEYKNAIAVPVNGEVEAKLLITDAEGKTIPDAPLGVYGLKTDKKGIVKFKVKVTRNECPYCYTVFVNGEKAEVNIYGDLLAWGYDYANYTKDGRLVFSTTKNANVTIQSALLPTFKDNISVVLDGKETYLPFDSIGARLIELYNGANHDSELIFPHSKDPSIIYTNAFVSKDYGKHFEKLGMTLDAIAVDPKNPNVVIGWSSDEPKYILKSEHYGLHFEKLSTVNINLLNNFVSQIVIDPNNSSKIYLVTWKGVYVSNDYGKNFSLFTNVFGIVDTIAIHPKNSNIIFLGSEKGIVKSIDGGKTWKVVHQDTQNSVKCIIFNDQRRPHEVFAGSTYDGLLVSYDEGETWKSLYKGDLEGKESIAILPYEDSYTIYIVSFRDGIYKSFDGGGTFTKLDFPVGNETSIAIGIDSLLYIVNDGIPFVQDTSGNILPIGLETFLVDGPKWKIINNRLFINVNGIKGDLFTIKVNKDNIEIYKMCDMLP